MFSLLWNDNKLNIKGLGWSPAIAREGCKRVYYILYTLICNIAVRSAVKAQKIKKKTSVFTFIL